MSNFLRDWGTKECQRVSTSSVTRIRDAWVQLVRKLAMQQIVSQSTAAAPCQVRPNGRKEAPAIFVTHEQDEASMRLRSTEKGTDEGMFKRRSQRARNSKVQNNSVSVCVGEGVFPLYCELQSLIIASGSYSVRWNSRSLLYGSATRSTVNQRCCLRRRIHCCSALCVFRRAGRAF
jgi:hypothetical protein